MKCSKGIGLLMTVIAVVHAVPSETKSRSATTTRARRITNNQLYEINSTSSVLLDVRTPPKVKEQQKQILKNREAFEQSHAGVAFPVDENIILAEATTKMESVNHSTTANGGSWVLLSGSSSTTATPIRNDVSKENSTKWTPTVLNIDKPKRVNSPHFKKRVTSEKPLQKVAVTESIKDVMNFTRIKASELNKAVLERNSSQHLAIKKPPIETSGKIIVDSTTHPGTIAINNSTKDLPAEAKDVESELVGTVKKKKTTTKRKNKNRRRKPVEPTTMASKPTKIAKQKPISTQIYSYLSREVMPTVGVGLVGLMVTAGLASYFFYPFGVARRSYDVDRKDNDRDYYYRNELSVPEEEAIGKVIAGMSSNTLYTGKKDAQSNVRYRLVEKTSRVGEGVHGSVEDVPLTYDGGDKGGGYYNAYQTIDYSAGANEDKLFVAGGGKTEGVTPATVPEHGPRNLRVGDEGMGDGTSGRAPSKLDAVSGPRYLGEVRRKRRGIADGNRD